MSAWDAYDDFCLCPVCGAAHYNKHVYCGKAECTPPEILKKDKEKEERWRRKLEEEENQRKAVINAKKAAKLRHITLKKEHIEEGLSGEGSFLKVRNELFSVTGYLIIGTPAELGEVDVGYPYVKATIYNDNNADKSVNIFISVVAPNAKMIDLIRNPDKIASLLSKYNEDGFKITVQG